MIENIYIEPGQELFKSLCARPKKDENDLSDILTKIFNRVKEDGDIALRALTLQFDGVDVDALTVPKNEIRESENTLPQFLKDAIQLAKENIKKFHKAQISDDVVVEIVNGVRCIQKSIGIDRVGIYIPGGTAPLFSTVLMLAIPAKLAGCKEIILCSPPGEKGRIHPAILYAAQLCGVSKMYKVGGAQAIAAMSIGTETIPSVNKVFGPGNQYVTGAKQYAQRYGVGMDSPAGPSELLVYADETAVPEFVAADLLSQAEHGIDSQVMLVATDAEILRRVNSELCIQIEQLPRKSIAMEALKHSKALVIEDTDLAFTFINEYGPEHLILATESYNRLVPLITNAGSVFLGNYCPESAGDYASGTNHTLPTDGWVKSYSGVNIDSFTRKITFQEISKKGIQNLGETIITMAQHEGLAAHGNAVKVRLKQLKSGRE